MYLVYLTSYLDRNSVINWLHINKHDNDYLIVDNIDDMTTELLFDNYDLIVFDYKLDINLIDNLRQLNDIYGSIQVFTANSKIGEAYLPITDNIQVLPKALNLMIYLWNHPAFYLGNILNAEEHNEEVFSIDEFADIDTENDILEFNTEVQDLGESDLASIKMLKVNKYSREFYEKIKPVVESGYAIVDNDSDKGIIVDDFDGVDEEVDTIAEDLGFDLPNLKGLIKYKRATVLINEALDSMAKADTIELVDDNNIVEEPNNIDEEHSEIIEEHSEIIEEYSKEQYETVEEPPSIVEEPSEIIEEPSETVEEPPENNYEQPKVVEEISEHVEESSENSESSNDTEINSESSEIKEDNPEIIKCILEETPSSPIEELSVTTKDNVKIVYEDYDESHKDEYDEVQEYHKAFTANTVIEDSEDKDKDIRDNFNKFEDVMGVVNRSTLDGTNKVTADIDGFKEFLNNQAEHGRRFNVKHEESIVENTNTKHEVKVLKGQQSYVSETPTTTRKVAIKTVEATDDTGQNRKGTLAGLRRRMVRTYNSSYEYFCDKFKYDTKFLSEIKIINDYVVIENQRGNKVLLEKELYSRNLIDDIAYLDFMRYYLRRQIYTLEDLMHTDVIIGEFNEDTCRSLRIIEVPSHNDSMRVVLSCDVQEYVLTSLNRKYENLELYFTLDKYIDMRLGLGG